MLEIIVSYITVAVTGAIFLLGYKYLTSKSVSITANKSIFFLIMSAIQMVNNLYNLKALRIFTSILIIFIMNKYWFKDPIKKTLFYTIVLSVISIFIELIMSIMASISFVNLEEVNKNLYAKSAITIIFGFVEYMVYRLTILKKIINKFEQIVLKKLNIQFFLIVLIIISNIVLMIYTKNYKNNDMYVLGIAILLFIFLCTIMLLTNKYKKDQLQIKNKFLNDNIKHYEIIAEDYRELKHNLNHDFLTIRSVANKEAQELIDEVLVKYNKNYDWTNSIADIPKGIQGIICIKLYEARKLNLNVEIKNNVAEDINKKISSRKYAKLCEAIGILMDNAIEASKKSKEKTIYIEMLQDNNIISIKIMNSFLDKLNMNQLGEKNYSTKQKKSGIGLHYLKKNAKNNFKIKKEIIDNIFVISLIVNVKN